MSSRYVLNVVYPTEMAQSLSLSEHPIVLGRSQQCDLLIEDEWVSRRHCQVWTENQRIWVQDLGSTNGTYIDGQQIRQIVNLNLGQRIQLGKIILQAFEAVDRSEPHTMVLSALGSPWENYSSEYLIAVEALGYDSPDQPFAAITREFLQHEIQNLIEEQIQADEYLRSMGEGRYLVYSSCKNESEAESLGEKLIQILKNHRFQWQETPLPYQFRVKWIQVSADESDNHRLQRAFVAFSQKENYD